VRASSLFYQNFVARRRRRAWGHHFAGRARWRASADHAYHIRRFILFSDIFLFTEQCLILFSTEFQCCFVSSPLLVASVARIAGYGGLWFYDL